MLKLLEERSPRTAADRASIAVSAADRITAQTLPNPTLSYGGVHLVSGLSTGAVTQHQMVVEQPLLLFHQRQARLDAADANVKAEEARVAETLAERRLAVRQTFASLLSRQEQLRVVQESLTNLERVAAARAGTRRGRRSQPVRGAAHRDRDRVAAGADDERGHRRRGRRPDSWPRCSVCPDGRLAPSARSTSARVSTDVEVLWATAERRRPSLVAASPAAGRRARRPLSGAPGATAGAGVERRHADDAAT